MTCVPYLNWAKHGLEPNLVNAICLSQANSKLYSISNILCCVFSMLPHICGYLMERRRNKRRIIGPTMVNLQETLQDNIRFLASLDHHQWSQTKWQRHTIHQRFTLFWSPNWSNHPFCWKTKTCKQKPFQLLSQPSKRIQTATAPQRKGTRHCKDRLNALGTASMSTPSMFSCETSPTQMCWNVIKYVSGNICAQIRML